MKFSQNYEAGIWQNSKDQKQATKGQFYSADKVKSEPRPIQ